jgi:Zn-dependent protease
MKDLALVSLAGPLTNIILALFGAMVAHIIFPNAGFTEIEGSGILGFLLKTIIEWNILLAILNLLPLPPLDGSKIFALLLPERTAASYLAIGNNGLGLIILLFLFYFPIGGFSLASILSALIGYSIQLLGF